MKHSHQTYDDISYVKRYAITDNNLEGGKGDDTLIGGGGADTFNGGEGFDVVSYAAATDAVSVNLNPQNDLVDEGANDKFISIEGVIGSAFNDTLIGNSRLGDLLIGGAGADSIVGGGGDDTIEGGAGADTMFGGDGIDTLSYEHYAPATGTVGVNVTLQNPGLEGTGAGVGDHSGDHFKDFEYLLGSAFNDQLSGNNVANSINGGAGNDTLAGKDGNDTLVGGLGADNMNGQADNDLYFVDNALDYLRDGGGQGYDTVITSVTFDLAARGNAEIEVLKAIDGNNKIDLYGNYHTNLIIGNDADNIIDGRSGADMMQGGSGNDTYYVDNAGDSIIETATGGTTDKALTTVSYTLAAYVENLTALGSSSIRLTGNASNNVITGNSGANTINASSGNDTLYGGAGKDTLSGGTGKDAFVFNTKPSSSNIDKVADFIVKDDTIQLAKSTFTKVAKKGVLAKGAFWTGATAHDKDDRIIYDKAKGVLYYDADGIGAGKAVAFATITKGLTMTYADFLVI
nr:calcium-binding protein [Microvirga terricola]